MAQFQLEIITPDGPVFDGLVDSLLVRTVEGDVEILRGHADYFAALTVGRARILIGNEVRYAAVSGGFLSVIGGAVRLVPVTVEFAESIDEARALSAKERATEALESAKDDKSIEIAKAKLSRALCRLNVASLK